MQNLQGRLRLANLTLYTIVKRICHIKDGANRRAKAASGRFASRSRAPQPHAAQKNPHVCVLNLAGSASGHREFANPQVDGLQGFGLLPPAELKRKCTSFLRAGESETHATHPHGRGCQCRALRFQVSGVSSPLRVVPAALGLSAPGTSGFQPTARQTFAACQAHCPLAPVVCHTPRPLAHAVSRAIACNASWFRTVSSSPRPGCSRFTGRLAPGTCSPRAAHPANARYLFGATFSSSQAHRNAKATRTRAPPA